MVKEAGRGRDEAAAKPGSWPWAEEPDNGQRGRPWPACPSRGRAMGWGLTGGRDAGGKAGRAEWRAGVPVTGRVQAEWSRA